MQTVEQQAIQTQQEFREKLDQLRAPKELGEVYLGSYFNDDYDTYRRADQNDRSWKRLCGRGLASCKPDEYQTPQQQQHERTTTALRAHDRRRGVATHGDFRHRN